MKVLICEHFHRGHHFHFVKHLLGPLAQRAEVVVALSPEGHASPEFQDLLAPFASSVSFVPRLPEANSWLPMSERGRLYAALRDAVRHVRPDYVLLPSGDGQVTGLSLASLTGVNRLPAGVPCELGLHLGAAAPPAGFAKVLRDRVRTVSLAASGVRKIHVLNLLFYERLVTRHPGGPFNLTPNPVAPNPRASRLDSRREVGLPDDGRYMGIVGSLDSRKAIPQALSAFRAARLPKTDRVVLAGWLSPSHARVVETEFADLLADRRLILLPGFLSTPRYQTVLTAMDFVCVPYPAFEGVAGTVHEAVVAGRPVLANDSGWMRAMVRDFGLGWRCDVLNAAQLTAAIRTAFAECGSYVETPAIRELIRFNSPVNYARVWTQGLSPATGDDAPVTWAQVTALAGPQPPS